MVNFSGNTSDILMNLFLSENKFFIKIRLQYAATNFTG